MSSTNGQSFEDCSTATAARAIGISSQQLQKIADNLPRTIAWRADPERPRSPWRWNLPALIQWRIEQATAKAQAQAEPEAGPPTPSLERLRRWKAAREQFAYERERGLWVETSRLRDAMTAMSGALADLMDWIGREYGRDAQETAGEFLERAERVAQDALGEPRTHDPGGDTDDHD